MSRPLSVYLIAGEPSGDRLGAGLMRALRAEVPDIRSAGIGGRTMAEEGIQSLFDISDLGVIGIVEVIPRLRTLLRRMDEAAADVVARAPDVLITIDSPGFGLRVAERVRRRAPAIPTIHYVAPSVWAWRPGRARQMARYIDHVLALLPFEVAHMEAVGMTCDFVGHPIASRRPPAVEDIAAFRARAGADVDHPLLLLAPGSRRSEIRQMMPVFVETVALLRRARLGLRVAVPVAESVVGEVTAAVTALDPAPILILPDEGEATKLAAFAAADLALVTSGTVTLEMAVAGTPMVSAYRTSWLTGAIVKRLIRVDTANLANLACGEKVVPEFYLGECTAAALAPAVLRLIEDDAHRSAQLRAFDRAMSVLGRDGEPPSTRAAQSILRKLGRM